MKYWVVYNITHAREFDVPSREYIQSICNDCAAEILSVEEIPDDN